MAQGTKTYFKNFFAEKEIEHDSWVFEGKTGMTHFIDSDFVIETLKGMENNTDEAKKLRLIFLKADLVNAPILPILKELAQALVTVDGR